MAILAMRVGRSVDRAPSFLMNSLATEIPKMQMLKHRFGAWRARAKNRDHSVKRMWKAANKTKEVLSKEGLCADFMEEFVAMEGIYVLDDAKARLESPNLPSRSP